MDGIKSRLQSKTIRAIVLAAILSVANAVAALTGMDVNFAGVEHWSKIALEFLGEGLTLGLLWRAYKGRVDASARIQKLPWLEEVKTLKKKGN